jgi:pyruvate,orthophosphate dikinase
VKANIMKSKLVYSFGDGKAEGRGDQRELLGGKGAGLAEMTGIGLPVPAGFTITVDACAYFHARGEQWPPGLEKEVRKQLRKLEQTCGKRLGDADDPLLVSVRSGSARSMPGMMETILNLGLSDASVQGLARASRNERFAWDAYRRFIQMYSTVVVGLSKETLEEKLRQLKHRSGVKQDTELEAGALRELCDTFKAFFRKETGRDFPQEPWEQLVGAINAVFHSWNAEKAVTYRRVERITNLSGTAVNVQQMVFGNYGDDSGTGVCFTRDPSTGANEFYGDMLINAQGEDVVAGIRTPLHLGELKQLMPEVYEQLEAVRAMLEIHYGDMQDLEFTIERGRLYMLQCRTGKRSPAAVFRIAVDQATQPLLARDEVRRLVKKGYLPKRYAKDAVRPVISQKQAVARIEALDVERLFYPVISPSIPREELERRRLAVGINAVPGAACGKVVFSARDAEALAGTGEPVILVRKETSPEDVGGMQIARGILTKTGGKTSHAAVVARGWGKCCIVGCEALDIDYEKQHFVVDGTTVCRGDFVTLDGTSGQVYKGSLELTRPEPGEAFFALLTWADKYRRLKVRANADTPADARKAIELGAEGIGLCRTEHMFFSTRERQLAIQEMIVAESRAQRVAALERLLPYQREDFIGIFEAMGGRPVTIRLIDPPLHEFVPQTRAQAEELARVTSHSLEHILRRSEQLHEANPMLGHRGCRLCVTFPEILDMQVRAILEAAVQCMRRGVSVRPEIMIPLTIDAREMKLLADRTRAVAERVLAQAREPQDTPSPDDADRELKRARRPARRGAAAVSLRRADFTSGKGSGKEDRQEAEGKKPHRGATRDRLKPIQVSYLVGTMIETPRAALTADRIAESAEFFSFGTNDLTQMTMGLSRDDAGRFLPDYLGAPALAREIIDSGESGAGSDPERAGAAHAPIFRDDPFQTLDADGVGLLMRIAIDKGRETRDKLKIGICGEHGGDPASIRFCHEVDMDYVSCSPFRLPVARLAAAQAAIADEAPKRRNRWKRR